MNDKWGAFTPGAWKSGDIERFGPLLSIFGCTRVDIYDLDWLGQHIAGEFYYRPLAFEHEPTHLAYHMIHDLPWEEQRDIYLELASKDGIELQDAIMNMRQGGRRPIIQLFNEPTEVLDDPDYLAGYVEFSVNMALTIYNMGAKAAVWGGGTGWLNLQIVEALEPLLVLCRGAGAIAIFEFHAYAPIHPRVWTGRNQSHGVDPNASQSVKWAAIEQDDWLTPITTLEQFYPSWLHTRVWGHDNGDGTYGFPALYDVDMLIGEGPVDRIPDERLPNEGGSTWFENRFVYQNRLGVPENKAGVHVLRASDDILNRVKSYSGGGKILRMAFCAGDGVDWSLYNYWRSPAHRDLYEEYLLEDTPELPQLPLDGTPPTGGNGDPDPPLPPGTTIQITLDNITQIADNVSGTAVDLTANMTDLSVQLEVLSAQLAVIFGEAQEAVSEAQDVVDAFGESEG